MKAKITKKTTFDVKLEKTAFEVRALMDLGLKEANDLVEKTSCESPTRTN